MTVYVDDMRWPYGRMLMSHLFADSTVELLHMVKLIGVQPYWIQYAGTNREHFDVAQTKRALAFKHGAVAVRWRDYGKARRTGPNEPWRFPKMTNEEIAAMLRVYADSARTYLRKEGRWELVRETDLRMAANALDPKGARE